MKRLLMIFLVISISIPITTSYASLQNDSDSDGDTKEVQTTEVSLSDETIIITQMISDPNVQVCIKQIEAEYKGHFNIWAIVRRPLNPEKKFEDGSAGIAHNSTYYFRGNIGGSRYKGPDAIAVDTVRGPVFSHYTCRIIDHIYEQ